MSPPPVSTIDEAAAGALQDALAAEHAALWVYPMIVVYLPTGQADQARADASAHRTLRAAIEQTLTDIGARPVSALPAYALPRPVTDTASAAALAVVAETDTLAAWRSVLEHTTDVPLRAAALAALTEGALRCTRWRRIAGQTPAVPVLPGLRP
ncbi:ferritin-like domain-containing protein [Pseudonocardia hispaniensis]|uniref:Ferritin-like domain-containing protein n=1 Tax=Pseudonocardia hispaniensis TaxID=904933 RepID=A0ABW1IXC9_9PSEU